MNTSFLRLINACNIARTIALKANETGFNSIRDVSYSSKAV